MPDDPESLGKYFEWLRQNGFLNDEAREKLRDAVVASLRKHRVDTYDELSGDTRYELRFREIELWPAAKDAYSGISGMVDDIEAGASQGAIEDSGTGIARNWTHEVRAFLLERKKAIEEAEAERRKEL